MKSLLFTILSLLIAVGFSSEKQQTQSPPNVVLIFMDDLGYGDISCFGATQFRTPNLDRMANEGIRFTNFLSAQAVCSS